MGNDAFALFTIAESGEILMKCHEKSGLLFLFKISKYRYVCEVREGNDGVMTEMWDGIMLMVMMAVTTETMGREH